MAPTGCARHSTRQSLARVLARYELFKLQLEIKGSIVECGVHDGEGLMTWANLSSALEPYAIHRKVIGFDTFTGFPSVDEKDESDFDNPERRDGGLAPSEGGYEQLRERVREYDANRFLNQFEKFILVKGDAL